jgi:hypothetical protein
MRLIDAYVIGYDRSVKQILVMVIMQNEARFRAT